MANYRMEIDALNALIDEQRKTNELLEKLFERGNQNELHENDKGKDVDDTRERRSIHKSSDQDGDVQPNQGRGKHRSRRNT